MKLYKKKVKKHWEVWASDIYEYGEGRIMVCVGNSNYGRLYAGEKSYDKGGSDYSEGWGYWLNEEETKQAFVLFAEIWEANKDYKPFGD